MKKQFFALSLLLFFGASLYAQPKAAGEPRVIAEMNEPLRLPVWSADGTKLSFTSLKNNGIWEVSINGTNFRQVSAEAGAGKRLRALSANSANSLLRQMTDNPACVASQVEALKSLDGNIIFNPVLSSEGDRIVFQVSNGKGLYICNADGSGLRSLGKGQRAAWMPDGKYIVVMLVEDNGEIVTKGELISIDVTSGERNILLSSDKYIALSPAVSPDGKKIAFEEYAGGAVYVMDIK
jgi:Tol biopolymer transport system component